MDVRMLSGEGRIFDGRVMMGVLPVNMPAWGDSLNIELGFDDLVRATKSAETRRAGPNGSSGKRVLNQERVVRVFNDGQEAATVALWNRFRRERGGNLEVTPTMGGRLGFGKRRGALAQCHCCRLKALGRLKLPCALPFPKAPMWWGFELIKPRVEVRSSSSI